MSDFLSKESCSTLTGGEKPIVIAGPCSAESEEQLFSTASALKAAGIEILRAGIWKPRTRPGQFEGVGEAGMPWMRRVKRELGMKTATEVGTPEHVRIALENGIDVVWIGARTSGNPFLVDEIAEALKGSDVGVLVKNPLNPDLELWKGAIERIARAGIGRIGAVHRGFYSYEKLHYRNAPLWQIPIDLKRDMPDLPLFCDPSHISGDRRLVENIARQAVAIGFDGLMIESHIDPDHARSDAKQQITPARLQEILQTIRSRAGNDFSSQARATITELRDSIDRIDASIIETLAERMNIARTIGELKDRENIRVLQPERWNLLMERILKLADEHDLDRKFIENLYTLIHQESIGRQIKK